ncbi:hypothetical protein [Saccharopolyspora sp. 5N708]|uniref:hypothetical protein n=1 Tax=Saccharopolyspora sp. 5N708 TaxID=3457424 RepID=UPI003FD230B1
MRFLEALLAAGRPLVMELKVHDGRGAALLGDRDPSDVVAEYERAGAPCLSVVTGKWFGGTPRLLRRVADRTDLPLLRKDFIVREADLDESQRLGADAVLLTAGLLPGGSLARLVAAALRRGLTPFVEVTSAAQIAAVPHPADCAIAVNNKDITTRERGPANLRRSRSLLPALLASGTRCPVSASGLADAAEAAALLRAGYAGLLIGSALLTSDVAGWVAAFDAHRRHERSPDRIPGELEPDR